MTLATETRLQRTQPTSVWLGVWAGALALVLVMFLLRDAIPWTVDYPAHLVVPVADWVKNEPNISDDEILERVIQAAAQAAMKENGSQASPNRLASSTACVPARIITVASTSIRLDHESTAQPIQAANNPAPAAIANETGAAVRTAA